MKRLLCLVSAGLLSIGASAFAVDIEVMTQNQYVGTDLIELVTNADFNAAVVNGLMTRAASLPSERVKALADLINKRGPALVGLEEVHKFTCVDDDPGDTRGSRTQKSPVHHRPAGRHARRTRRQVRRRREGLQHEPARDSAAPAQ